MCLLLVTGHGSPEAEGPPSTTEVSTGNFKFLPLPRRQRQTLLLVHANVTVGTKCGCAELLHIIPLSLMIMPVGWLAFHWQCVPPGRRPGAAEVALRLALALHGCPRHWQWPVPAVRVWGGLELAALG